MQFAIQPRAVQGRDRRDGDGGPFQSATAMHIARKFEPLLQLARKRGRVLTSRQRQLLVRCTRLATVNLAENGIRDLWAQYVAEALPQCVSLSHLNLSARLIYDKSALALARALTSLLIPLEQLNLSGNVIGAWGAGILASMLQRHDQTLFTSTAPRMSSTNTASICYLLRRATPPLAW